ncbi:hypothetical protein [Nonomuraea sp. NPDC050310]|uniref:hypothetical protein n=1 Tax=Nonomuraea sp. NPDC050310 TaxID=3154935 RepID=UPI0033EA48EB
MAAVTAVREWVNAQRGTLTGPGTPIPQGAFRQQVRSTADGAYVVLSRVGGTGDLFAERPADRARISASIYAGTDGAAELAAVAYANAVEALSGTRTPMGDATCLVADNVTGPLLVDNHDTDREQFHYVVDADFYLI